MELTNPLLYFLPVFIILIGVEMWISVKHQHDNYHWKDLGLSISMGVGASILATFTKAVSLLAFWVLFDYFRPFREAYLGYADIPWTWWSWILVILGDDLCYYWYHRLSHTVRILWAAHSTHHSSRWFNLGTAVRNSWTTIFYKAIFWLWLPMLGFHPLMIGTALAVSAIYQFFLHTRYVGDLGWAEYILNTPESHMVHHSKDIPYLDKNHAGVFIIWDRAFGTYLNPKHEPLEAVHFGILKDPQTLNPLRLVTFEFAAIWQDVRRAKSFREALMYIFGAPGWSPDGSTLTAKQMQARYYQEKAAAAVAAQHAQPVAVLAPVLAEVEEEA